MLKNKKNDILGECFDNIKDRAFYNVLKKAVKIQDTLRLRIIKKFTKMAFRSSRSGSST